MAESKLPWQILGKDLDKAAQSDLLDLEEEKDSWSESDDEALFDAYYEFQLDLSDERDSYDYQDRQDCNWWYQLWPEYDLDTWE